MFDLHISLSAGALRGSRLSRFTASDKRYEKQANLLCVLPFDPVAGYGMGDQAGATAATLYSLIASAERQNFDPQRYLTSVLAN